MVREVGAAYDGAALAQSKRGGIVRVDLDAAAAAAATPHAAA